MAQLNLQEFLDYKEKLEAVISEDYRTKLRHFLVLGLNHKEHANIILGMLNHMELVTDTSNFSAVNLNGLLAAMFGEAMIDNENIALVKGFDNKLTLLCESLSELLLMDNLLDNGIIGKRVVSNLKEWLKKHNGEKEVDNFWELMKKADRLKVVQSKLVYNAIRYKYRVYGIPLSIYPPEVEAVQQYAVLKSWQNKVKKHRFKGFKNIFNTLKTASEEQKKAIGMDAQAILRYYINRKKLDMNHVLEAYGRAINYLVEQNTLKNGGNMDYHLCTLLSGYTPDGLKLVLNDSQIKALNEQAKNLNLPELKETLTQAPDSLVRASALDGSVTTESQAELVNEIQALAASGGVVTGKAYVVTSLEDFKNIKDECILVANNIPTDVMRIDKKIEGMVVGGGMLCHGAIIARETCTKEKRRLPCVAGVDEEQLAMINTGDVIKVDGTEGIVTILDRKKECKKLNEIVKQ